MDFVSYKHYECLTMRNRRRVVVARHLTDIRFLLSPVNLTNSFFSQFYVEYVHLWEFVGFLWSHNSKHAAKCPTFNTLVITVITTQFDLTNQFSYSQKPIFLKKNGVFLKCDFSTENLLFSSLNLKLHGLSYFAVRGVNSTEKVAEI